MIKINAPEIEVKFRHKQIVEAFDDLKPGEFMELLNDHDPKPLRYQFMMERECFHLKVFRRRVLIVACSHWQNIRRIKRT